MENETAEMGREIMRGQTMSTSPSLGCCGDEIRVEEEFGQGNKLE